jgi:hypothetical protein
VTRVARACVQGGDDLLSTTLGQHEQEGTGGI